MNEMLNHLGVNAKAAETEMRNLSTDKKNEVLLAVADRLVKDTQTLIRANAVDVEEGKRNQMPEGLIDRLLLQRAESREWQKDYGRLLLWMIPSGKLPE